jgi:hypothetical protein
MRTDLLGGEDILAKLDSLTEQQQAAQDERASAEDALREARRSDIAAEAEAVRSGAEKPKPTEPAAQKRLDAAVRSLEVLTRAVVDEREAWQADLHVRDAEIRQTLAEAEDTVEGHLKGLIELADSFLAERDEIRAHRVWLDDTSRHLSTRRAGNDPLAALRASVNEGPSQRDKLAERREYEAKVDAWNAFVKEACANVPQGQKVPVVDAYSDSGVSYPAIDRAIEQEIRRREEAGEAIPVPVVKKWIQHLGIKPKSGGPGWSPVAREVPTVLTPDEDSAVARRQDIARATHPSNAAPGHPALTNIEPITEATPHGN